MENIGGGKVVGNICDGKVVVDFFVHCTCLFDYMLNSSIYKHWQMYKKVRKIWHKN